MKKLKNTFSSIHTSSRQAIRSFSIVERVAFLVLIAVLIASVAWMLALLNKDHSIRVPAAGGTYTEGVLGTPRFINPVLADSSVDEDITRLVYAGLMRSHGTGVVPDLAKSFTVSDDGLTYTFTLRDNVTFHDKTPVTADDVVFTIESVQNSAIKSPKRASWTGVAVEKLDAQTIQFQLSQPYAGFLQNTTLGILPRHLWGSLSPEQFSFNELNVRAVGAGPYKIKRIQRTKAGVPEKITFTAFKNFAPQQPYIKRVIVRFYANKAELETALTKGGVDAISAIDPETAAQFASKNKFDVLTTPLPRVFGLYFNKNEAPIFLDTDVVEALDVAINKAAIVKRVLQDYGTPLDTPIPPGVLGYEPATTSELTTEERKSQAGSILDKAGWVLNEDAQRVKDGSPLSFTLATSNSPELKEVAAMIKEQLAEIGISVDVQVFEAGNLEQDIIRPREYQALLFGQVIQHDTDLFAFWHSSQRNDPGLNVALYTDTETDRALSSALEISDNAERKELYASFTEAIKKDKPAIFLYAPDFIYVTKKRYPGILLDTVRKTADRWNGIHTWYLDTNNVWRIFTKN